MMPCTCPTWSLDSNFIKSLAQWFAHLWAFGFADLLLVPLSRVLLFHETPVEVCSKLCRQFQHRRIFVAGAADQPVLTHAELVEHLLQKSAGLKAYLPFEGMNQVVYKCKPS